MSECHVIMPAPRNDFNFVLNKAFADALRMGKIESRWEDCHDLSDIKLPVLRGHMGVGKSRTARELCLKVVELLGQGVALEVDVSDFASRFTVADNTDQGVVMAARFSLHFFPWSPFPPTSVITTL